MTTAAVSDLELELREARRRVRQLEQRLAAQCVETRSQEEKLATLVDHAPVILWSLDRDGIVTLSEGRALEGLKFRPGELLGQSVFDLYRDDPVILDQVRRALSGRSGTYLNRVDEVWLESWIEPIRDTAGNVTGVIGVSTDVTARQQAQLVERTQSEQFQRVFRSSPVGTVITELESGRLLDVNPAFCRLVGYAPEELIGRTGVELGFWADAESRRAALAPALDGVSASRVEHRLPTRDGQVRIVQIVTDRLEFDGRACLLTIVHDATEQKRWETALRRSRRRYRQLARFVPVGIFRATHGGNWTYANGHLCRLWGRDAAALHDDGWLAAVDPEDRSSVESAYRDACAAQVSLALEFRIRPQADCVRWIILRMEANAARGAFLGTATDITQRIQTAQQLQQMNVDLESRVNERTALLVRANQILQEQIFERRRGIELLEESEGRWRSLVENAPDIILQVNPDRSIGFINHTHARPNLAPENVIGRSLLDFVFPVYHEQVERDLDRVFECAESVRNEVAAPDDHGQTLWFHNQISPILRNGAVTGATVVCRDITEIKHAAEELKQTQDRLIQVARVTTVGEMAAALAHELNQPLAAIAHYVRGCMIRLQAEAAASPEILQTLQESVDEAHRASEVIRRLRQFLQRHELQCESVLLNDIVEDAMKLAEPAFHRHQTEAHVTLSSDVPIIVVDRVQLIQVVLNLLLNGAEAMAESAQSPRTLAVETALAGAGVEVRIADRGPGLPAHLGETIFEPFVTTKSGGLGIGLSISRTIVEAHQGTLRCETPGSTGGARFVISLPVVNTRTAK